LKIALLANSQGTTKGALQVLPYPEVLRDALAPAHDVVVRAESGWTIRDFNRHLDEVLAVEPDLVVLQVGIVECSRRILSATEKRIIRRLPRRHAVTKFLHDRRPDVIRWRARLRIDTRLYSVREFSSEIDEFLARCRAAGTAALLLEIPSFGAAFEQKHFPLINDDIAVFNEPLRRNGAVAIFEPGDPIETIWQEGTVHFTAAGHELVAERIAARIEARTLAGVT
jgi:lysophospholipase L1-like esterase